MSILGTPLGMNPVDNPLVFSPFGTGEDNLLPPSGSVFSLVTEGGTFILTEGGVFLTTE